MTGDISLCYSAQLSVNTAAGLVSIDETESLPFQQQQQRHAMQIVDTRDRMVREGLIRLGWTPPAEEQQLSPDRADAATCRRVRASDAASSMIAAERASEFAVTHSERILRAMREGQLSAHQIARLTGLTVVQVDRRLPELLDAKRVELVTEGGEPLLRAGYRVWQRFRSRAN